MPLFRRPFVLMCFLCRLFIQNTLRFSSTVRLFRIRTRLKSFPLCPIHSFTSLHCHIRPLFLLRYINTSYIFNLSAPLNGPCYLLDLYAPRGCCVESFSLADFFRFCSLSAPSVCGNICSWQISSIRNISCVTRTKNLDDRNVRAFNFRIECEFIAGFAGLNV